MVYYRVKPQADQTQIYNQRGKYLDFLIANELYTQSEYNKLIAKSKFKIENKFEQIEIPKNKTYFFFGARFTEYEK